MFKPARSPSIFRIFPFARACYSRFTSFQRQQEREGLSAVRMSLLRQSRPPPPGSPGGDYSPLYHESDFGPGEGPTKGNTAPSDSTRVSRSTLLIVLGVIIVAFIGVYLVAGFALGRTFAEGPLVLPDPPIITKKRTTVTYNVAPSPLSIEITATATPYLLQFPSDLSDYVGRVYSIYSNHSESAQHRILFTSSINKVPGRCSRGTGPTFDQGSVYPGLTFEAGGKDCFVSFRVVECGEIAVIESRCASFCDGDFVACTGPHQESATIDTIFGTQASIETVVSNVIMTSVLAHTTSGEIPATHSKQTLANDPDAPASPPVTSLASTPLGLISAGQSVTGGTLLFKPTSGPWTVRDLAADVYTSVSDTVGTRVIQGGSPEAYGSQSDCGTDTAVPNDSQTLALSIFASNFQGGLLTIYIRSGSEQGYDYAFVKQNGHIIYSATGAGPSPSNAFLEGTVAINMKGTDVITVEFVKDGSCWGGYDMLYIYATLGMASNIAMTLPSDLSSYVGKEITLCSLDVGPHTVTLEGGAHYYDSTSFWQTLQFQGSGEGGCCATLSFISANALSVTSRDPCTVFCTNATSSHCVDPLRPAQTSPFHGNWKAITKTFFPGSYAIIDATRNPISVVIRDGTVISPKEAVAGGFSMYPISGGTFAVTNSANLHNDFSANYALTFQPGAQQFVVYSGWDDSGNEIPNRVYTVFEKVAEVPPLVPTGPGTLTTLTPEDPEAIVRNWVELFIYGAYGSFAVDEKWIGYENAMALLNTLISTGTGPIVTPIIETRVTQSFNPEGITEFRTADYHHAAPPVRVTISGFTGSCTDLNGDFLMAIAATNNVPLPHSTYMDYGSNPAARTVHHKVGVFLDSSSIPVVSGTQIADCPGSTPVMSVQYGPINSASSYIQTQGAIYYWLYEAVKVALHTRMDMLFDESTTVPRSGVANIWEQWSDVIANLAAGEDPNCPGCFSKRVRTRPLGDASSFYTNAASLITEERFFSSTTADQRLWLGRTDLTGRFGIRPDRESSIVMFQTDNSARSTHWISVPRHNYLEQAAYPAWKTIGTTRSHYWNLAAQASYPGGGGDEFDAVMVPSGTLPPADYSYLWSEALPNGGYAGYTYDDEYNFVNEINQEEIFVGRIKPAYTGGINIGYIRFQDVTQFDPLSLSIQAEFCPTDHCDPNSFRNNREALTSIYAKMMQYLITDLDCDHVILDSRANGGGSAFIPPTIRDFFGGEDQLLLDYGFSSRTDNGYGASTDVKTLLYGNNVLTQAENSQRVSPLLSETNYPGSVLTNGELVFLTNTDAGSGGDIFPNTFLGSAFDGQLGNNTQVSIIGSIDGRLTGYACSYSLPTSRDSPRLKNSDGSAHALTTGMDCGTEVHRTDGSSLANRHPGLAIDSADGITGLNGGNPLVQDWDELVYKDLGYVTNTRTVLPGWTGPQTPSNFLETNPLSVTSGSNVVTVTTSSPHGFTTGDDVALGSTAIPVPSVGGLSSRVLTGAHIITVTSPTTFTFETAEEGINFDPSLSDYSPSFVSPTATSTVSGAGGVIRITNRSQWRDHWLEASISTIVSQAKKRRYDPEHKKRKEARKARLLAQREAQKKRRAERKFDIRSANKLYGRNVACPEGKRLPLIPIGEAHATRNVTLTRTRPDEPDFVRAQRVRQAITQVADSIKAGLASGGLCLDAQGAIMATPSMSDLVKIVPADGRVAADPVPTFHCPPVKSAKTAKNATKGVRRSFSSSQVRVLTFVSQVDPKCKKMTRSDVKKAQKERARRNDAYNACIKACGTVHTPGYRQCILKCSPTVR